jgi:hypothetical protein
MEPDDIPVHDLLGVGDSAGGAGGGAQPGPDELRAIVARAGRRRRRITSVGVAAALIAGGAIGYAVSNHSSSPAAQTATASGSGSTGAPAPNGASSSGASSYSSSSGAAIASPVSPLGEHFTALFGRTAGGITIRGYLTNYPQPSGALAQCSLGPPPIQVEVSTAKMVGTVSSLPLVVNRSQPTSGVTSSVVGLAEGDPTAVVMVATGSGVSDVSMSFAGGATDQMVPVKGWAVLAGPVAANLAGGQSLGTLVAKGAGGQALSTTKVTPGSGAMKTAGPCGYGCGTKMAPGSVPGGTSSTGGVIAPLAPTPACRVYPPCAPLPAQGRPSTTVKTGAPALPNSASGRATFACPLYSGAAGSGSTGAGGSTSGGASTGPAITTTPAGG